MAEAFEIELKNIFLDEAVQLLADAEQCFLAIEKNRDDPGLLDKIFRMAHNLKGSANAVGFYSLGELTHEMESFLLKLKAGDLLINSTTLNLLLRCNDQTTTMVQELRANPESSFDVADIIAELRACGRGESQAQAEPIGLTPAPAEAFAVEGFSLFSDLPAPAAAPLAALPAPVGKPASVVRAAASADESIRVSLQRLETLLNFVGEQVILHTVLKEQILALEGSSPLLRKTIHQLGKVTKEVQVLSMSMRMVPLRTTFQKMQRIVRDTSAALGKSVALVIVGEETEVDKTVLEMLGDPLVHLIRNAVDHGIEDSATRLAAGKPAEGTVRLKAYHRGDHLLIEISEDGAGMNAAKLRERALEKGLIKPGAELTDQAAYQLIFQPGFSTKAVVTDVSGRGVGMDVVKTNVEQIQGEVLIATTLGQGTTFTIRVPLTLAIIEGLVIRNGAERFVVPLAHVYESKSPTLADVHTVSGVGEVYNLRGEDLPLYRLSQLIGQRSTVARPVTDSIAVVVRNGDDHFAVLVDDIVNQCQVVIKRLGAEHQGLKGFGGSAILGDGRAVLILELTDLVARQRPQSAHDVKRSRLA